MLVGVALFLMDFVVDFFFFFDVSGGLLMTVVMVGVLFSVFCFAMDCGCHDGGGGGGGGGGNGSSVVVVNYCVKYIILLCYLYYFNV